MKIYIDQQFVTDSTNEASIIQDIEKWLADKKRIITSHYLLDDESITGDWLNDIKLNANTEAQLQLHTEDLIVVLTELKATSLDYVAQIEGNLPGIIEQLYTVTGEKSLQNMLYDLIEGIEYLLNVAVNLNLEQLLENHEEMLKELLETLESNDQADCADLLNYEWLPWFARYKQELLSLELE